MTLLNKLFSQLLKEITKRFRPHDKVRIILDNNQLDYAIQIPFGNVMNISVEKILGEIERVLQSFEDFILDKGFTIDVTHVKMPYGKGKVGRTVSRYIENIQKAKRSIIHITNNDDLCCARALVVGRILCECRGNLKHPIFQKIVKNQEFQSKKAEQLCNLTVRKTKNIQIAELGTLSGLGYFSKVLRQYRIIVVSKAHLNMIIYDN